MKIKKIVNNRNPKLLLCFAGWSASPETFAHLEAEDDQDVWVCYDYRDLSFGEDPGRYRQIDLMAWSLGVWVAAKTVAGIPLHSATAVNGTELPVDDTFGIPSDIFLGTLRNVTDDGMSRFNRRMCGSRELLEMYRQLPARPVNKLQEELQSLYAGITQSRSPEMHWTKAIISTRDKIFPVNNQRSYWQGRCPAGETDAPHYPFYLWKRWKEITG